MYNHFISAYLVGLVFDIIQRTLGQQLIADEQVVEPAAFTADDFSEPFTFLIKFRK